MVLNAISTSRLHLTQTQSVQRIFPVPLWVTPLRISQMEPHWSGDSTA